uniref:Uncharacterized protein n=2 Tax=Parascaris univalens TaxID=6257 RepID=A0A915BXP6_PARUN
IQTQCSPSNNHRPYGSAHRSPFSATLSPEMSGLARSGSGGESGSRFVRSDAKQSGSSLMSKAAQRRARKSTDEYEEMLSKNKEEESERDVLLSEEAWLQKTCASPSFTTLERILRDCCRLLHLTNKLDSSVKLDAQNPTTERLQLVQRSGGETLKVSVAMLGDAIILTEVTMKYAKAPGGIFRSRAQPDVQWKLQQLQDAGNYCAQALMTAIKAMEYVNKLYAEKNAWTLESGDALNAIVSTVINLVGQARSSLCLPHKRTLVELCNFPPTRCFNPPLPPDLVFSYYIASTRIVCAAYLITSKPNGAQGLAITQAECQLPQLVELLSLLTRALNVAQELRGALSMFETHIRSTNDEENGVSPTRL